MSNIQVALRYWPFDIRYSKFKAATRTCPSLLLDFRSGSFCDRLEAGEFFAEKEVDLARGPAALLPEYQFRLPFQRFGVERLIIARVDFRPVQKQHQVRVLLDGARLSAPEIALIS